MFECLSASNGLRHEETCWAHPIEPHTKWRLLGSGPIGGKLRGLMNVGVHLKGCKVLRYYYLFGSRSIILYTLTLPSHHYIVVHLSALSYNNRGFDLTTVPWEKTSKTKDNNLQGCLWEINSPANKVIDVEDEFQRQWDSEWKSPCKGNLFA